MSRMLNTADAGFEEQLRHLLAAREQASEGVREQVAEIIARVRREGDAALAALTERFDRWPAGEQGLALPREALEEAKARVAPDVLAALELAAERIRAYH